MEEFLLNWAEVDSCSGRGHFENLTEKMKMDMVFMSLNRKLDKYDKTLEGNVLRSIIFGEVWQSCDIKTSTK